MYSLSLLLRLILIVGLLAISSSTFAQNELVVRDKPMKARNLGGRVQIGISPEGVKGVLVEDCSKDWKNLCASPLDLIISRFWTKDGAENFEN